MAFQAEETAFFSNAELDKSNIFSDDHKYNQKELLGQVSSMASTFLPKTDCPVRIGVYAIKNNGAVVITELVYPDGMSTDMGWTTKVYGIAGRRAIIRKVQEMYNEEPGNIQAVKQEFADAENMFYKGLK